MPTTAKGTPYVVSTDLVANYPTVSSDLADHIDDNLAYNAVTINAQTGSGANAYTFALADASEGKLVTASNAAAATYTVPPQSAVTWANGAVLRILNQGAGVVTIAGGSGVTLNGSPLTIAQYKGAYIVRTASNTWTVIPEGSSGKILQVVSAAKTDTFTTNSTTFTDITGLSVSITPSTTASRIYIAGMLTVSATAGLYSSHPLLVRDTTPIFRGDAAGTRTRALMMVETAASGALSTAVNFVDSPATTSATTYKFQIRTNNASYAAMVNRSVTDTDSDAFARGVSSITVMEIAP